MRIAKQSIWAGLGLSGVAMLIAAFGGLPPIAGAAIQEIIDVAVILNALRTSRSPRLPRGPRGPLQHDTDRLRETHAPIAVRRVSPVRA
jgi:hypothetical protein